MIIKGLYYASKVANESTETNISDLQQLFIQLHKPYKIWNKPSNNKALQETRSPCPLRPKLDRHIRVQPSTSYTAEDNI